MKHRFLPASPPSSKPPFGSSGFSPIWHSTPEPFKDCGLIHTQILRSNTSFEADSPLFSNFLWADLPPSPPRRFPDFPPLEVYILVVRRSVWFPLSQLMIHGVIVASHGDALHWGLDKFDPVDFAQEASLRKLRKGARGLEGAFRGGFGGGGRSDWLIFFSWVSALEPLFGMWQAAISGFVGANPLRKRVGGPKVPFRGRCPTQFSLF